MHFCVYWTKESKHVFFMDFQYGCFESFPFRQNFVIFVRQITWFQWNAQRWTSGVNVHNKNSICAVLLFDHQLKKILAFSVKDRYQLKYLICIKDFNAETITSLKLNLFSFFICGCHGQHHQRKTICLYVYISDIRQIVGYQTPVFIQRFHWRFNITITYNLPHLRLWYADVTEIA
jgi:hypothetical protein